MYLRSKTLIRQLQNEYASFYVFRMALDDKRDETQENASQPWANILVPESDIWDHIDAETSPAKQEKKIGADQLEFVKAWSSMEPLFIEQDKIEEVIEEMAYFFPEVAQYCLPEDKDCTMGTWIDGAAWSEQASVHIKGAPVHVKILSKALKDFWDFEGPILSPIFFPGGLGEKTVLFHSMGLYQMMYAHLPAGQQVVFHSLMATEFFTYQFQRAISNPNFRLNFLTEPVFVKEDGEIPDTLQVNITSMKFEPTKSYLDELAKSNSTIDEDEDPNGFLKSLRKTEPDLKLMVSQAANFLQSNPNTLLTIPLFSQVDKVYMQVSDLFQNHPSLSTESALVIGVGMCATEAVSLGKKMAGLEPNVIVEKWEEEQGKEDEMVEK